LKQIKSGQKTIKQKNLKKQKQADLKSTNTINANNNYKKLPIKKIIISAVICGIVFAISFTGITAFIPDFGFNPVHIEKTAISNSILLKTNKIFQINTVGMTCKSVFPYDYIISTNEINKIKQSNKLSSRDVFFLKSDSLCRQLHIKPEKDEKFIVISAFLTAGYKGKSPKDFSLEKIATIDNKSKSITIQMPQAKITSFIIEDPDRAEYKYPPFYTSPEIWEKIISHIKPEIERIAIKNDLLKKAELNAADKLKRILKSAGWKKINIYFTSNKISQISE
jgi:hypothetical protein